MLTVQAIFCRVMTLWGSHSLGIGSSSSV